MKTKHVFYVSWKSRKRGVFINSQGTNSKQQISKSDAYCGEKEVSIFYSNMNAMPEKYIYDTLIIQSCLPFFQNFIRFHK